MIQVKLVSVCMANRMRVSHLCQSKNSEVLNIFHPESGRGLAVALEKVWRKNRCVDSPSWLCGESRGPGILLSRRYHRKTGVGPLGIIYQISRMAEGWRW